MSDRRVFAGRALCWPRSSLGASAPARRAGDPAVDVRQRRSTKPARRCRTSARPTSSSARTTSRAKCCASRRPTSRCRSRCSSTTARPRATTSATCAPALPAFVDALTRPPTRRAQERDRASSRSASGRRSSPNYTTDRGAAAEGHRPHLVAARQRHVPARRHHRGLPGLQEARGAAPGHRRDHDRGPGAQLPPLRPGARPAARRPARRFHVIVVGPPSSEPQRRCAQSRHRARRGHAARPAAGAISC